MAPSVGASTPKQRKVTTGVGARARVGGSVPVGVRVGGHQSSLTPVFLSLCLELKKNYIKIKKEIKIKNKCGREKNPQHQKT